MGKSYRKNIIRMIQTTKSRFFSLFAIVMIGVAFFIGVSSSSTMLAYSVDAYNDRTNLKDFTIYSSYGFNDEDIAALEQIEEVECVETSKFADVVAGNEDFQVIARVHGFSLQQTINAFDLKEGRLPRNEKEVLAEKGGDITGYFHVGDVVTFQRKDGDLDTYLKQDTYTVVGLVDSAVYLNQSRESSTLSNQAIDTFFYVLEDAFSLEISPELNILTKNGKKYNSFSSAYDTYIESVQEQMEKVVQERENSEYENILQKAQDAYQEGLVEYQDGYASYQDEIFDAQQKLEDAQNEIDAGYETLRSQQSYIDAQAKQLQDEEARGRQQLDEAKQQIEDAKQQVTQGTQQLQTLQSGLQQLYPAKAQLEQGMQEIQSLQQILPQLPQDMFLKDLVQDASMMESLQKMDPQWQEYTVEQFDVLCAEKQKQMQDSLEEVESNLQTIEMQLAQSFADFSLTDYEKQRTEIQQKMEVEKKVQAYLLSYEQGQANPEELAAWMQENAIDEHATAWDMYAVNAANLEKEEEELSTLEDEKQTYVVSFVQAQLDGLTSSYDAILEQESVYQDGLQQMDAQLAEGKQKLQDGYDALAQAQQQLQDAQRTVDENRLVFAEEKENGYQKLMDAKKELEEAKEQIDSLEEGQWTLLSREQHYASVTFEATVKQMAAIGRIFPLFFLMVAILVCLTTMSRTISEQRGEIGVMRALGYSRMQCMMKYLVYAAAATLLGEAVGVVVGIFTFPIIIYETWRLMYNLPPLKIVLDGKLAAWTCLLFLAVMLATTFFTAYEDMKENSASLLRPKAPKLGKKILLERVKWLWMKLSFSWKITIRNLFRYKRRFIMTVLGIAGCSALLATGFGIRDSITSMVSKHFDEIVHYEGYYTLSKLCTQEEIQEVSSLVGDSLWIAGYQANVFDSQNHENSAAVQIFDNAQDAGTYYSLRTRLGHNEISLDDSGVIIDEKLSELLNVSIGDSMTIEDENGKKMQVRIAGIMEYYLNHVCLMSRTYYERAAGQKPYSQVLLIQNREQEEAVKESINLDYVESLTWFPDSLRSFDTMISSLNLIIWTIIVSSMVLAFVVLGNLMNVNISERSREIATLKVLGFHPREVQHYIYNENNVLTLLGALAGLPLGKWLHRTIMRTVEMDYVMFGRTIQPMSYLYALGLTVLFGLTVNFFMRKYLKNIQMVESLKSVE